MVCVHCLFVQFNTCAYYVYPSYMPGRHKHVQWHAHAYMTHMREWHAYKINTTHTHAHTHTHTHILAIPSTSIRMHIHALWCIHANPAYPCALQYPYMRQAHTFTCGRAYACTHMRLRTQLHLDIRICWFLHVKHNTSGHMQGRNLPSHVTL